MIDDQLLRRLFRGTMMVTRARRSIGTCNLAGGRQGKRCTLHTNRTLKPQRSTSVTNHRWKSTYKLPTEDSEGTRVRRGQHAQSMSRRQITVLLTFTLEDIHAGMHGLLSPVARKEQRVRPSQTCLMRLSNITNRRLPPTGFTTCARLAPLATHAYIGRVCIYAPCVHAPEGARGDRDRQCPWTRCSLYTYAVRDADDKGKKGRKLRTRVSLGHEFTFGKRKQMQSPMMGTTARQVWRALVMAMKTESLRWL